MDPKALTQIVLALVDKDHKVSKVLANTLPPDIRTALDAWVKANNIPINDAGTSVGIHKLVFKKFTPETYIASYSGDNPDQFALTAVLQQGKVIGESIDVGS